MLSQCLARVVVLCCFFPYQYLTQQYSGTSKVHVVNTFCVASNYN